MLDWRGAVLIAGPTASGKSALALAIARERNGVVVNADSMQVYRDLRVITARPSTDEEARAPHRLYGHRDAAVNCSVGMWLDGSRFGIASSSVVPGAAEIRTWPVPPRASNALITRLVTT